MLFMLDSTILAIKALNFLLISLLFTVFESFASSC